MTTHSNDSAGDGDLARVILVDGEPRSSCCRAPIQCQKDYTDTHVYDVERAEVDDSGRVVAAYYRRVKTYDGIDGTNWQVTCSQCDRPIDEDGIDFEEVS